MRFSEAINDYIAYITHEMGAAQTTHDSYRTHLKSTV